RPVVDKKMPDRIRKTSQAYRICWSVSISGILNQCAVFVHFIPHDWEEIGFFIPGPRFPLFVSDGGARSRCFVGVKFVDDFGNFYRLIGFRTDRPAAYIIKTMVFKRQLNSPFIAISLFQSLARLGKAWQTGSPTHHVDVLSGFLLLTQFDTGLCVIQQYFGISDKPPGNRLFNILGIDIGIYVFPAVIAGIGTIPVFNGTVSCIDTVNNIDGVGTCVPYFPTSSLYAVVWVEILGIQRTNSPGSFIIQDRRIKTWFPVLIRLGGMCRIVPVEFGTVTHFKVIDQITDRCIGTPAMITVGRSIQPKVLPHRRGEVLDKYILLGGFGQEQVNEILGYGIAGRRFSSEQAVFTHIDHGF